MRVCARSCRAPRPMSGSSRPPRRSSDSGGRPADHHLRAAAARSERPAREPPHPPASRRLRPPLRRRDRPRRLGAGVRSTIATRRWRSRSTARRSRSPAGRGTIYDRTGEPLAIGEQATTVYADPRNVADAQRAAVAPGSCSASTPNDALPELNRPVARASSTSHARRIRARRRRSSKLGHPGARLLPGGAARLPAGKASPRRSSASPAPTTTGSTGSSARWTGSWPGARAARRSSRTRSGARSTSSSRRPERPGRERDAHDRPPDPGERRARSSRRTVRQFGARGGCGDRHRPADGRGSRDGERPDVRRESASGVITGRTPQPGGDRRVRAGLDLQDRDDRRCARGRRRHAERARSRSPRRSRSPTA